METSKFFKYAKHPLFSEQEVAKTIYMFVDHPLDLNKITRDVMLEFVEMMDGILSSYGGSFDLNDQSTWDVSIVEEIRTFIEDFCKTHKLYLNSTANESYAKRISINEKATDKDIERVVMKELDDSMIMLLSGLITGEWIDKYSPEMRQLVYNHIKNNREKTQAGRVLLSTTYFENRGIPISQKFLLEKFGFNIAKSVQNSKYPTILIKEGESMKMVVNNRMIDLFEDSFTFNDKKNGVTCGVYNFKDGSNDYIQFIPKTSRDLDHISDKFTETDNYAQEIQEFYKEKGIKLTYISGHHAAGMVFSSDTTMLDKLKQFDTIK